VKTAATCCGPAFSALKVIVNVSPGAASIHHRVDDAWVTPERFGHHECDAFVCLGGFRDQPRQILGYMAAGRQHERMYDDAGRALLDTARESFRDARFRELHVSRFDDASRAKASLHERGHVIEKRIGFGASTAVVDQEQSRAFESLRRVDVGLAHREYLGP